MTEPHVPEERLMALADGSDEDADAHVRVCADCSETLNFYRTLNAEMKDRESWRIEEEIRTRRGARSIADFAARIEAEDAAAPALLDELLERLARDRNMDITADSRFLTGGVFRALDRFELEQKLVDPLLSERLSRLACALTEALPDDYYPANAVFALRGRAWMMHSNACAAVDRYTEAFEDADRAQRAYEQMADPGVGLADVKLTRAIVYHRLGRHFEGLPLAKSAADEYEQRGDRRKYAIAVETTGAILNGAGEYAAALKVSLGSLQAADELQDAEMRARILYSVGILYRKVGELDKAGESIHESLQIWEGLGMKAAVAHCRWSIALVALAQADFVDAEKMLRATVDALRELGSEQYAADAKLDLAEALLMLGRPQEIEKLCTEAEAAYAKLGLVTGRLEAARYLRNAAAKQLLRREDVQHVRTYLEKSRAKPETPFAPPPKNGH
jgi:tetratricopeptide (TPR) repeat protein